ncbi:hypothetical protein RUM43_001331 [Polyplax serrata]|uniref:Uncharacterized protein n=1 Tax=Polyplax serrata TaxID=468196 RepID=A0AAN8XQH0_POLSC
MGIPQRMWGRVNNGVPSPGTPETCLNNARKKLLTATSIEAQRFRRFANEVPRRISEVVTWQKTVKGNEKPLNKGSRYQINFIPWGSEWHAKRERERGRNAFKERATHTCRNLTVTQLVSIRAMWQVEYFEDV